MEMYIVFGIVDRNRSGSMLNLYEHLQLVGTLTALGSGTATSQHLSYYNLEPRQKTIIAAAADREHVKRLLLAAKRELYIDIPGNGILFTVPIKSVAGRKTLARLTDTQSVGGGVPNMDFQNELIVVLLNEGQWDSVMDTARAAGATGGTVLHAKGTGKNVKNFFGLSLAEEKDVLFILAPSATKSAIMQAIRKECGEGTKAEAICLSLPVSEVAGIRAPVEEDEP